MIEITNIKIELQEMEISIGRGELSKDEKIFHNLRITTPAMTIEYWHKGPHYAHLEYEDLVAAIKSYEARQKKRRK